MLELDATISSAAALPEEQQLRLARILDDYLAAAERGAPQTPDELLEQYPNEADHLRRYLSALRLFEVAAGDVHGQLDAASKVQHPTQPSGRVIGDFRIVREIGRGGMGVVYEAEQISLRRRVALKVLPFTAAGDSKQLRRFVNEAQAAAQVQHPNIVPVYAVGDADGVHYFAMQLIEGRSLAELVGGRCQNLAEAELTTAPNVTRTWVRGAAVSSSEVMRPPLTPMEDTALDAVAVARYGQQAADALHAAHEYGVVHRDVKPSNLLIDRQGKLWVVDFGLARCREGADLTRTGDVCGTTRYMSPEQARGQSAAIDHRTDIYSLAVTLYELAAGRHPADEGAVLSRGPAFGCKPLRHWDRRIPVDFETIVMKAMAESAGERYDTAQAFADDLGRFLAGEPIHATPPSRLTRARKWAARRRRTVGLAVGVLAGALVWMMASASYVAGIRAQRDAASAEANETSQWMDRLLYDVPLRTAEQLADIPGADGVRRQLLEESLQYYVRLSEQAHGDAALGAHLALAYSKIAGLATTMGDREKAIDAYRDARRILDELIAVNPDNDEYARSWALCRSNAGLMLVALGRTQEAHDELTAARDLQDKLHRARPQWDEVASDLAATLGNLGMAAKQQGDATGAAQWLRAAVALQEPLLDSRPDDDSLRRRLAASYNNLGSLEEPTERGAAMQGYRRAISLQRRLVANQPLNQVYQVELARSYNNLGYAAALTADWTVARKAYADAILLQQGLVRQSPLANTYQRDLAITRNNLGMALCKIGKLREAEQEFKLAIDSERRAASARSVDGAPSSNLGAIYNNLGMLLARRGRLTEATDAYQLAIRHQRRALDARPDSMAARELLSKHYHNFAKVLQRQGRLDDAVETAEQRQSLWRDQPERQVAATRELTELRRLLPVATTNGEQVN